MSFDAFLEGGEFHTFLAGNLDLPLQSFNCMNFHWNLLTIDKQVHKSLYNLFSYLIVEAKSFCRLDFYLSTFQTDLLELQVAIVTSWLRLTLACFISESSMGLHRVVHDWSDLAATAVCNWSVLIFWLLLSLFLNIHEIFLSYSYCKPLFHWSHSMIPRKYKTNTLAKSHHSRELVITVLDLQVTDIPVLLGKHIPSGNTL